MNVFKWQTEEKFLANMMLLSNSVFLLISGYYFIADGKRTQTPTYDFMAGLMALEVWGVLMVLSGLIIGFAAFQTGMARYFAYIVGGFLGAIVVTLYAMAATQGAELYLVPVRYAVIACFNLLIAALGGVEVWRIKRVTSRTSS